MSPAEDALLLLRVVQRHLGSLRGTVTHPHFADGDGGFPAQPCAQQLRNALLDGLDDEVTRRMAT